MKIWTTEEEAQRLTARFSGVNRAAFARDHSVKGGQAMIYQHIKGLRPMNLDAARAYASGFKCSLDEISPRLAQEVAKSNQLPPSQNTIQKNKEWPFSIGYEQFQAMPEELKKQVGDYVEFVYNKWHSSPEVKRKKA